MSLRITLIAGVGLAWAGLAAAQAPTEPTTPGAPTEPTTPSAPTTPTMPSTPPVPTTPTPSSPPGVSGPAVQPLPVERSAWTNQDGSTLVLIVDASGAVTGTFTPGFACGAVPPPAAPGAAAAAATAQPVAGTASGNAIVWTVTLPDCPSVGTWIGHYQVVGTEEQLRTLWTLAVVDTPPGVGAVLTGADLFVRQPG